MGLPEIAAFDPETQQNAAKLPEGSCHWKIMPNGPAFHITLKDGALAAAPGELSNPSASVEFKDINAALEVLTNKVKAMEAIMSGKLSIKGMTQIPLMVAPMQQKVGAILKGENPEADKADTKE